MYSLFSLIKLPSLRSHYFSWSICSPSRPSPSLNFNYLITFMREGSISNFISYMKGRKNLLCFSLDSLYLQFEGEQPRSNRWLCIHCIKKNAPGPIGSNFLIIITTQGQLVLEQKTYKPQTRALSSQQTKPLLLLSLLRNLQAPQGHRAIQPASLSSPRSCSEAIYIFKQNLCMLLF